MELLKERIAIPCWECHGITRTRPCEHCRCDHPEEHREEYEAERVLVARVLNHLGNLYRLRVPLDAEEACTLVPDPRYRDRITHPLTLESVPLRIVEIMKREQLIRQIQEFTDAHFIGWREIGLDGALAEFYCCKQ